MLLETLPQLCYETDSPPARGRSNDRRTPMTRRVVITGAGVVAPHGAGPEVLFKQLVEGVSGVARIQNFDPIGHPTQIAAEVRYDVDVPDRIGPYEVKNRSLRFAVHATQQAMQGAGLDAHSDDPRRRAVVLATGIGSASLDLFGPQALEMFGHLEDADKEDVAPFYEAMSRRDDVRMFDDYYLDLACPVLATQTGSGQAYNPASACASGGHTLAEGLRLIRRGDADIVFAGGAGTPTTRTMIPGFAMLKALSRRNDEPEKASRPFDAERDGFVMGEGAATVVLEDLDHAVARGADILGELVGAAVTTDAYRLTDPDPSGAGMARALRGALDDARVDPDEVDYVNAHGTSTKFNDAAETRAIKEVLGERAYDVPVSSSKSMFGHIIHAAGTTEAVVCLQSIANGVVHPTVNQEVPDPACDLDYVPNEGRDHVCDTVVSNSFGFGGQNVSLVLRRFEG